MTDLEREVRRVLADLAEQARPVPLGRRALAGLRRRRRRRARIVAAAAALAAVVTVPQALAPTRPVPDLNARNVVAAYVTGAEARVLDPTSGRYRRTELRVEAVTADLRFAAGRQSVGSPTSHPTPEPKLGVLSTRTGELAWLGLPQPIKDPAWSPDGRYVVAQVDDAESPRAVLIDPEAAQTSTISLHIPADLVLVDLCWSDAEHLLAVAAPGAGAAGDQQLIVLDKDYGRAVRTTPVPGSWRVRCDGRQGRVLATRPAERASGAGVAPPEVTIIDGYAGTIAAPVGLDWAGVIDPVAWRSDGSFLARSRDRLLVVDIEAGTVAEVRARYAPRGAHDTTLFIPARGLERHAREVADAAF